MSLAVAINDYVEFVFSFKKYGTVMTLAGKFYQTVIFSELTRAYIFFEGQFCTIIYIPDEPNTYA